MLKSPDKNPIFAACCHEPDVCDAMYADDSTRSCLTPLLYTSGVQTNMNSMLPCRTICSPEVGGLSINMYKHTRANTAAKVVLSALRSATEAAP